MKDGQSDRAMHLMLTSDDDAVEQAPLGGTV